MPLDAGHTWQAASVVPGERIIAAIDAVYPLEPLVRGSDPAEVWAYADGRGRVGAIPSVTAPFCAACDRVRLTAEGKLRSCLFSLEETDLRPLLREGGSDEDLLAAISSCVARKWAVTGSGRCRSSSPRGASARSGVRRARGPRRLSSPDMSDRSLTHLDPLGRARMVDVTPKDPSHRRAIARCRVHMEPETTSLVARGAVSKGDVLAVARVAGIQAAKRTSDLIPLCHPLLVGSVLVNFTIEDTWVEVEAQVEAVDRTGVEMEA